MTKFALILATLSSCLVAVSCQHTPNYAQQAYLEQRAEKIQGPQVSEFNQQGEEELLVQTKEDYYDPSWDKRSYEDNEEWFARVKELIETNQETLNLTKNEHRLLEQRREKVAEKIHMLIQQSQMIKQQLADPEKLRVKTATPTLIQGLPFVIHLVHKDETLFAISMKYYKKASKVRDIMRWNEGWIRNENSIIAGLGIILFPEDATDQDPRVVNSYMEKVRMTESKDKN